MPELAFRGLRASWHAWGGGRPLALLHSGGSSGTQWTKIAEALAPTYRSIAPDFLGFGATQPWPEPGSLTHDLQADLVAAVLEAEGVASADVVGHSYGGGVAIRLALRRPDLVRSLLLIEPILPALLKEAGDSLHAEAVAVGRAFIEAVDAGRPEQGWQRFIDSRNGAGTWAKMSERSRERFLVQSQQTREGFLSNFANRTTLAEVAAVAVPTTVACSEHAIAPDRRLSEILAATIPGARSATIPDAGHMAPLTHPERVTEIVGEHIAQCGAV